MTACPPQPPEPLGQRIGRLRARRGWTQQELADRLAASRVAVSHFEMGLALPSERTVVLLAGLFGMEPHELVAETNYPTAKAERLPPSACRYTELELQLALLRRDMEWAERIADKQLGEIVVAEWLVRLAELSSHAHDAHELKQLEDAHERLRRLGA